MDEPIDYRALLKSYMQHVQNEEGYTFITTLAYSRNNPPFSPKDLHELYLIDKEIVK